MQFDQNIERGENLTGIYLTSLGWVAHRQLASGSAEAKVTGLTSRGIFISIQARWLTFLSWEDPRGPLTLNLRGGRSRFEPLQSGDPVEISKGCLFFPTAGLHLSTRAAPIWRAPDIGAAEPQPGWRWRLDQAAKLALRQKSDLRGLSSLLPALLGVPGASTEPVETGLLLDLEAFQKALSEGDAARAGSKLAVFLGLGPGLTPSGDDLILGVLLSLNRWGNAALSGDTLTRLNQSMVEAAYQKTTTLSANLIECASLGQADERLVAGLDGIISGTEDPTRWAEAFTSWGSSSGLDALTGMVSVLLLWEKP